MGIKLSRMGKMRGGSCQVPGCGAWTGHGMKKICIDCERLQARARLVETACAETGCPNPVGKRGARYCMEHRGMRRPKAVAA